MVFNPGDYVLIEETTYPGAMTVVSVRLSIKVNTTITIWQ